MNENLNLVLRLVICIFLAGLLVCAFFYKLNHFANERATENIQELTPICQERCERFNMTFYEIASDGWSYSCWCIDTNNNKPFQVAILK